jgi:hypothetical protein
MPRPRNTIRHSSRNTLDGATQVANLGEEAAPGLGGASPAPLPLGPDPARHARFNVIHGVGQRCVVRTRGPCVQLLAPTSLPSRAIVLVAGPARERNSAEGWTRRSLALPCTRGLTTGRTPNPGLTLRAARQEDVPRQVDGATSDFSWIKSDAWYPCWGSARGGKRAYTGRLGKDRSLGESRHSSASPK